MPICLRSLEETGCCCKEPFSLHSVGVVCSDEAGTGSWKVVRVQDSHMPQPDCLVFPSNSRHLCSGTTSTLCVLKRQVSSLSSCCGDFCTMMGHLESIRRTEASLCLLLLSRIFITASREVMHLTHTTGKRKLPLERVSDLEISH